MIIWIWVIGYFIQLSLFILCYHPDGDGWISASQKRAEGIGASIVVGLAWPAVLIGYLSVVILTFIISLLRKLW